ncbi:FtsX-like permease family protein [Croceimicrobium hydrocarbonivorans]|uniref:ABC transporter permease n=1 Tax=Croceimicrobium hydrocarbonivorans TaxID=2761580 RepID=A0A7H0VCM0_9FLAO|nr:ABC transporter permease [Croceimicrobium hydrocarbonivorans]QNR23468.1 ABC transporter permease [Croceimicrobium hydrocarbonivorans]
MMIKLLRKTLHKFQLLGYLLSFVIGCTLFISIYQLRTDLGPLFEEMEGVINQRHLILSKNVSLFKSLDKSGIYFSEEELESLQALPYVKEVAQFQAAQFKVGAFLEGTNQMPGFYSELFLESIPDAYLDLKPKDWHWEEGQNFVPIIIPESYLTLYNLGFAESQGLPVVSKSTINQIAFQLKLDGRGQKAQFRSRIVGFSTKINSILVPDEFLSAANRKYGSGEARRSSRLILDLNSPKAEELLRFAEEHNYQLNQEKMEYNKLSFLMEGGLYFLAAMGILIMILALFFVLLSTHLILQKNRDLLRSLHLLGYSVKRIAQFYQYLSIGISLLGLLIAALLSLALRSYYQEFLNLILPLELDGNSILLSSLLIGIILIPLFYVILIRQIRRIVAPAQV